MSFNGRKKIIQIYVFSMILLSTPIKSSNAQTNDRETCDSDFEEIYLSARDCTLHNDPSACNKWSIMSLLTSGLAPGAAALTANHFVRNATMRFLEMRSELPRFKELIDRLDKISSAMETARRAYSQSAVEPEDFIKAQRQIRGTVIRTREQLITELINFYQKKGSSTLSLEELKSNNPAAYRAVVDDLEKIDKLSRKIHLEATLTKTQNPLEQQAIRSRLMRPNDYVPNLYGQALQEFFTSDDFEPFPGNFLHPSPNPQGRANVARIIHDKFNKLTPRQQVLFHLLERYYDYGVAGTLGGPKGQLVISEEVIKTSTPKATKMGWGAGIAAGLAAQFGPTLVANVWDRNQLGKCQKELGLLTRPKVV